MLKIQCLGGVGTVTGSKFLVATDQAQVLIDCGLFQGYKTLRERNWAGLPIKTLDAVVLTHAHLDHSGYLPVLRAGGLRPPVYCHPATASLLGLLLPDSGHLQEEDARFLNRHKLSRHNPALPLYTRDDAEEALKLLSRVDYDQSITVGDLSIRLQPAGHILGAATVIIEHQNRRVVFSGDLGKPDDTVMYPPRPLPDCDVLFIESTYGNRLHDSGDPMEQLASVVNETVAMGGTLAIPSFAVGRAHELQYMLARLMQQGAIPALPVFLDSPMAIKASAIYSRHHELHRLSAADCALMDEIVTQTQSVEESKALSSLHAPHIIIAGSGMLTGGRIVHHLKRLIDNPNNTILLAGFQASGTRGAQLAEGAAKIRIHGDTYPVKARVELLDGLSAHADQQQLLDWIGGANRLPQQIYTIHGEAEASECLRQRIEEEYDCRARTPDHREWLHLFDD